MDTFLLCGGPGLDQLDCWLGPQACFVDMFPRASVELGLSFILLPGAANESTFVPVKTSEERFSIKKQKI